MIEIAIDMRFKGRKEINKCQDSRIWTWRCCRELQKLVSFWAKLARTGSIDDKMVPHSPATTRNSEMQATMHWLDSDLTSPSAASRELRVEQSRTSAFFMDSREAMLSLVKLRRTLLSPTTETRRDILKLSSRFGKEKIKAKKLNQCLEPR